MNVSKFSQRICHKNVSINYREIEQQLLSEFLRFILIFLPFFILQIVDSIFVSLFYEVVCHILHDFLQHFCITNALSGSITGVGSGTSTRARKKERNETKKCINVYVSRGFFIHTVRRRGNPVSKRKIRSEKTNEEKKYKQTKQSSISWTRDSPLSCFSLSPTLLSCLCVYFANVSNSYFSFFSQDV